MPAPYQRLVDAHQHFWKLSQQAGGWPTADLKAIYRDFAPQDLEPLLIRHGIGGTVLVQTQESLADTHDLLDLASRHAFILGVVGWVDLKAADAPSQIAQLARHPKLKGLRPMLQGMADDRWIDDPALDPAVAAMQAHRLCFDALVLPHQLPGLLAFAQRHPGLPMVIDHAAKPLIAQQRFQPWLNHLRALSELPHVHCKLSGLLTEAGERSSAADLQPYVDTVLGLFGPTRVLWGSDWPVLELAADYALWLDLCRRFCAHLPDEAQAAIFGGNAERFYRLT